MCTWFMRSAGWSPRYSAMAPSGPCMYAKPLPPAGLTPLALASTICAFVSPSKPVPGQVSLLIGTEPPSSVVERQQLHLRLGVIGCKRFAHVSDVPAEVPDRRRRRDRRRGVDLAEQHEQVARRRERGKTAPARRRGAREPPGVELDRGGGIDRVQMQMME